MTKRYGKSSARGTAAPHKRAQSFPVDADGWRAQYGALFARHRLVMDDDRAQRFLAFLDAHHVMSLATAGADGPHAANLFYARDGFALIWVSDPTSRHSLHVEGGARVAATVA